MHAVDYSQVSARCHTQTSMADVSGMLSKVERERGSTSANSSKVRRRAVRAGASSERCPSEAGVSTKSGKAADLAVYAAACAVLHAASRSRRERALKRESPRSRVTSPRRCPGGRRRSGSV